MFVVELILALIVAIVLAIVLAYGLRRRGPGPLGGLLFFLLIIFLAAWAGGVWISPVGPAVWGVPWLGFVVVGVILALILGAAIPSGHLSSPHPEHDSPAAKVVALTLGLLFYLAIFALIISIFVHYARWW